LPWESSGLGLRRPSAARRRAVLEAMKQPGPRLNTTIGVVATSARLDKSEASKVASVAHDGLARAIRPAHGMTDGDTIFCLATGDVVLPDEPAARVTALNSLLRAGADVFAAACTHAIVEASTIGDDPAWRDLVG
ncbi:MAG: P1 family peptidase, partial [Ilumatobacter sp.]